MAPSEAMERLMIVLLSLAFSPAIFMLSFVIVLAGLGKTVGIRNFYIKTLLIIFEWGRQKIEKHDRRRSTENALKHNQLSNGDACLNELTRKETNTSDHDLDNEVNGESTTGGFHLCDAMDFCKQGIESIVEDDVTQRFDAAELPSWNLLTRTNTHYQFISLRLTILWFAGFILRYIILFPARFVLATFSVGLMIVGTAIIGYMPDGRLLVHPSAREALAKKINISCVLKKWCNYRLSVTCYRIMMRAFTAIISFHNRENRAKSGGICVANHTSPIDIIVLGCDNCYAMVGQAQGGFMGIMQRAMSRAESHIWFNRSEIKDRLAVAERMRNHVENPNKLSILIFPEGTCINNTSIMMFKKGSFEVGGTIYPVAIKYDPRFANPFWNSSEQSLSTHLLSILTSWALVVDVWYLPPQKQRPNENAAQFANRVKADIARKGGLVDLDWDGGLKRSSPKPSMKRKQQEEYSKIVKGE